MTKICTSCKLELLATKEYFSPRKRNKNGLHELCRACRLARDKKYKEENKEMYKEIRQKWSETNKEKLELQNKLYSETHKERKSETNRLWHERNREKKNNQVKEWALKNKDRRIKTITEWRINNKKRYNDIIKKYKVNNKEKCAILQRKRKSIQKLLPSTLTLKEWEIIKKYFNHSCAYCGENKKLEQDHFVPLKNGGEYTIDNIVPACRNCNSSKKDKKYEEWFQMQSFYDAQRDIKINNRKYNV